MALPPPHELATAMMLLSGDGAAKWSFGQANKTPQTQQRGGTLLKELLIRHPAILHFRRNSGLPFIPLEPGVGRRSAPLAKPERAKFGAALAFWKRKRIQGVLLLHRTEERAIFRRRK